MSVPLGQPITLTFLTYSDEARTTLADATTVSIDILDPVGVTTTYTLAGAQVVHIATGTYTLAYTPAVAGRYVFHWTSTGTVATALDGSFTVLSKYGAAPSAFATSGQLAAALGVPAPTDPLLADQWTEALEDASGYLRTVIGQPITAGTATLDLLTDGNGEADVWLVPVTSVVSVVALDTNTSVDTSRWQLKDQRLYLPRGRTTYRVVVNYGYTSIPTEIVRWTKVLAAAQIQVAGTGSLGIDNITSVAIDDGKVSYAGGNAVELPPATAQWLKATFGGPQ